MKEKEQLEEDKERAAASGENAQLVDANLVATLPPATSHEEQHFVPAPARGKNLDGTPREKTFGEKLFDWSVYAGIGWIGNEFASGLIHDNTVYRDKPFYKMYEAGLNKLHKLFKQAQGAENWTKLIKRPFDILIMTIGGNLLVIPMKIAEDHKGALVRIADNLHGKQDEAKLKEAHEEMDAAPQQTWGSLLQSRVVTMLGAVGIDYAFGADDAWTSHISKSTKFKQWSTLNNINTSVFRLAAKGAEKFFGFDKGVTEIINENKIHSPFNIITNKTIENMQANDPLKAVQNLRSEGKIAAAGKSYGFIFLLSGVLAGTFYLTSRVFAFNRDLKEHQREEKPHGAHKGANPHHESAPASVEQLERNNDTPKTKVSHAHVTDRLAQAPQEAVGING